MIRVGIIGMGFMGGVHLHAWRQNEFAQVAAVCDRRPIDGKTTGNLAAGGELDLSGVAVYSDLTEMLESETLDAVSITLPTHLHRAVSIQCLEAGLHVLCEKPMALNTADCDAMIAAADAAKKQLMIAHCIRFWPAYTWLKTAVEQGRYGRLVSAEFSRLSSAPGWSEDSWFADPAKSGGIALDLHIHDLDFIQYLLGAPKALASEQVPTPDGRTGQIFTRLDYGEGRLVSAVASWLMPKSYGFSMSFRVVFEAGAAVFEGDTLTVYPAEGDAFAVELVPEDGYTGEINYFADLVRGTATDAVITPAEARASVRMALESMKS